MRWLRVSLSKASQLGTTYSNSEFSQIISLSSPDPENFTPIKYSFINERVQSCQSVTSTKQLGELTADTVICSLRLRYVIIQLSTLVFVTKAQTVTHIMILYMSLHLLGQFLQLTHSILARAAHIQFRFKCTNEYNYYIKMRKLTFTKTSPCNDDSIHVE